ncbi:Agenet domain-containing protein [Perilla frutescens var. frutescens]|nr:Agenet domain-containing protein [Perilla frutescens var. frutescens]
MEIGCGANIGSNELAVVVTAGVADRQMGMGEEREMRGRGKLGRRGRERSDEDGDEDLGGLDFVMEPEIHPFEVGQMTEVKTFEKGFRGAWFRCKFPLNRIADFISDVLFFRHMFGTGYVCGLKSRIVIELLLLMNNSRGFAGPEFHVVRTIGLNWKCLCGVWFSFGMLKGGVSGKSGFMLQIKKISMKKGRLGHILEYLDFPDEELKWTTLYQATFRNEGNTREKHKELMLRPHYPPIYNEKQMPHVSEISEVTVIVADSWRVGDLVDWWNSDCYWSGRITQLLGDNEAQIDLKPLPHGEGLSYKVLLKELRPSLDWCPELGWTVPTQEGDTGRPCAHLVKPTNQGQETKAVQRPAGSLTTRSLLSSPLPSNSDVSDKAKSRTTTETQTRSLGKSVSKKWKAKQDRSTSPEPVGSSTRKANRAVADSGQNEAEPAAEVTKDELKPDYSQKKYRVVLNSTHSHTLEAAVLDLEEYLNKVKWLKKKLQYGISSSDAQRP